MSKDFQTTQQGTSNQIDRNHENAHVHFSSALKEPPKIVNRRLSFALDENSLSNLKSRKMPLHHGISTQEDETIEDDDDDEEEEMFFLDEEMSEDDERANSNHEQDKYTEEKEEDIEKNTNPISASFRQSVFEIDKKYPWIKKKRDTSKYLAQDFDIKKSLKDKDRKSEEDAVISTFATSVPITINYPFVEKENEEKKDEKDETYESPKKKDILAKSFANYDFSYSDRLLSEQFPAPYRKRSNIPGSSSVINPQLHSLVGKSLDTRGSLKKTINQLRPKDEDEDFDSSIPPHVWAAKETKEDELIDHSYKSKD